MEASIPGVFHKNHEGDSKEKSKNGEEFRLDKTNEDEFYELPPLLMAGPSLADHGVEAGEGDIKNEDAQNGPSPKGIQKGNSLFRCLNSSGFAPILFGGAVAISFRSFIFTIKGGYMAEFVGFPFFLGTAILLIL